MHFPSPQEGRRRPGRCRKPPAEAPLAGCGGKGRCVPGCPELGLRSANEAEGEEEGVAPFRESGSEEGGGGGGGRGGRWSKGFMLRGLEK